MKYCYYFISFLLLIYLVLPGPQTINDFPSLPNSAKSTLSGDTWQVPNVVGYFSNNYRDFATSFYRESFWKKTWFPFPPIRINYPPEYAYTAIKDQTQSTYLEEYVYPLKSSLYVNGFEPFTKDGQPRFWGAIKFNDGSDSYYTKVTLRYYYSSLWVRFVTWFGITLGILLIWKMGRRIVRNG